MATPNRKPSALERSRARLALAWAIAATASRDHRIPARLLRTLLPLERDRRALRNTLRAVVASAPLRARPALLDYRPQEPSLELLDALTAAVDMAATPTERRSLEYARASCARALAAANGTAPSRS